ncbi:MAG: hypothetical protein ABFS02_06935, partial [Pseudomonadota bacterium]
IKAKIDTAARRAALHAFFVDPCSPGYPGRGHFGLLPGQHYTDIAVESDATVKDRISCVSLR